MEYFFFFFLKPEIMVMLHESTKLGIGKPSGVHKGGSDEAVAPGIHRVSVLEVGIQ